MRLSTLLRTAADDSWSVQTISVLKRSGKESVSASVLKNLGVHPAVGDPGEFSVTHVPTGYSLAQFPADLVRAKKFVERLLVAFPGLGEAPDGDAVGAAIKAGGGLSKFKSMLSSVKKGAPKQPWQNTWKKELRSALIAHDRKLEQKGDKNVYRIGHLLAALEKIEAAMAAAGPEAKLTDLKAAVLENLMPQSLPTVRALMKKWGIPFEETDQQQSEKKFFRNLGM